MLDSQVILWEEDSKCPRQWLLDNVKGIDGLLVMLTERVRLPLIAGKEWT